MKLKTWTERPIVAANLTNPAFCCEIIKECAKAFKAESNNNLPFSYAMLVLPFILPANFRSRMPRSKATSMHAWLNDNESLKIDLSNHIKSFNAFSKESIMFGIVYNSIRIDESGHIEALGKKAKSSLPNEETNECLTKAGLFGRILANAGDQYTIFSMLGIKP
ncbi:MAG: hypothetical protein BGO69_12360 [Bacteroidetes bacterium 46-16]|nr:MAG: hypothetical protein BGO69_12360 [Bacteroidetes bacterium 46-16]